MTELPVHLCWLLTIPEAKELKENWLHVATDH